MTCNVTSAGVVKLPAIISDNMVLQADTDIPIWGWADSDEAITVTIAGQTHKTIAGIDGKWLVRLDPIPATNKSKEMIVSGQTIVTVKNILIGQVWLGSGQSNFDLFQWHIIMQSLKELTNTILGGMIHPAGVNMTKLKAHWISGLDWARGCVATAQGPISISWEILGTTLVVNCALPQDLRGRFVKNNTHKGFRMRVDFK